MRREPSSRSCYVRHSFHPHFMQYYEYGWLHLQHSNSHPDDWKGMQKLITTLSSALPHSLTQPIGHDLILTYNSS